MRFDVVGLGIAACDFVTRVDRFPGPDEKVRSTELEIGGGGTVGTALVAVARLGLSAAFAGTVGEDDWGKQILESLEREGVDTGLTAIAPGARSPFSFCVSHPPHRNVFSIAPTTPSRAPEPAELDEMLNTRFVHLDGADETAALDLARAAQARGISVSLDLQRVRRNTRELLACADVAVVSENFASEAFGQCTPDDAVLQLWRPGMQLAAITMGSRGAIATEGGEPYRITAEEVGSWSRCSAVGRHRTRCDSRATSPGSAVDPSAAGTASHAATS